ncbi:MAG: hypothetical protein PHN59_06485 [Candidatus Omnitrophica bacterium]|nr:hypothetical protein [Candidatus Omnitrophota bacterium]
MNKGFMGDLRVQNISFWSYLKLAAVFWLCFGFNAGVINFVVSLIAPERVLINFFDGAATVTGLSAGLLSIPFWPLLCAVFGVIFGVIAYFPFKLFLKIAKGIKLNIGVG